ncbi:MAG: phosphatase [Ruthenibacterium sp.]
MKKSTLIAWVAFFSAIAGALAAAYFYIQRREAELDEYEQLLFSEDFCDEAPENEDIPAETDDENTETEE